MGKVHIIVSTTHGICDPLGSHHTRKYSVKAELAAPENALQNSVIFCIFARKGGQAGHLQATEWLGDHKVSWGMRRVCLQGHSDLSSYNFKPYPWRRG
jgi:hypothetical protein